MVYTGGPGRAGSCERGRLAGRLPHLRRGPVSQARRLRWQRAHRGRHRRGSWLRLVAHQGLQALPQAWRGWDQIPEAGAAASWVLPRSICGCCLQMHPSVAVAVPLVPLALTTMLPPARSLVLSKPWSRLCCQATRTSVDGWWPQRRTQLLAIHSGAVLHAALCRKGQVTDEMLFGRGKQ